MDEVPLPTRSSASNEAIHSEADSVESSRVLVAVCTYNERENLPPLVEAIHRELPGADILVVDDDSPDGTGRWAEEAAQQDSRLQVLVRRKSRGLGGAIRAALDHAVAARYQWLLNLDGDHSHDPADLPRLLEQARRADPPVDVVVGSRYVPGGAIEGWPLRRRWMSRMVNALARKRLGLPVHDCSGALRCYRVAALERIDRQRLRSNGYALLEELLLHLHRSGARMTEIPITFIERQQGRSKLSLREALTAAAQIARMPSQ